MQITASALTDAVLEVFRPKLSSGQLRVMRPDVEAAITKTMGAAVVNTVEKRGAPVPRKVVEATK